MRTHKAIIAFSIFLAALFILAQFVFKHTGFMGPWCSPTLTAPHELGHPFYEYADYGFPIPAMEVLTNICAEPSSITYNWLPIGLGVDSLLLVLLLYPIWSPFLKKEPTNIGSPE